MKKLFGYGIFFLILFSLRVSAQTMTPDWEISLPSKVKWMQLNDWGIVIAACENGLYGIDPRDGKKIWEVPSLTNVWEENYSTIHGTPLMLIVDKGGDAKTMIVNGLTGNVVFNSAAEGIEKIASKKIIAEIDGIMVAYSNVSGDGVALFSYLDGEKKWDTPLEKAKKGALQAEPLIDGDGNIMYANGSLLYKLNGSSGEIMWQAETKKKYIDLFTNPDGSILFAVSGSPSDVFYASNADQSMATVTSSSAKFYIESLDPATGSANWKKPIEYSNSKYGGVALGENDYFLIHTIGANKYPYTSPGPVWKKEKLGTGGAVLDGIFETSEGLIYVGSTGEGRSSFNYMDAEGKPLWKKRPQIVGQLITLEDHGDEIFYITSKGANFISKEDGKMLWERDKYLAGSVPIRFVEDENGTIVMYVEGKLIRIDPSVKDWETISSDFGFRGELPSGLQQNSKGYVLTGNQNVALIGPDGKKMYQQFYPAPEQSFGTKLALGAVSTATAFGSMAYGMSSLGYGIAGAMQGNDEYSRKADRQLAIASFTGNLSGGFEAMAKTRFGEQVSTDDYKLILTQQDKNIGFVKIDLLTGQEDGMVVTADRTPQYVVDSIDDKLFLKSGDTRVACYLLD